MELLIAEKIRKLRRDRNVTQEKLAADIGISPQSVSKWECGDGYPDITLLPKLAGYFGVTVDELLGCDELSVEEDIKSFFQRESALRGEERLALAKEYFDKYPKDYHIAVAVANTILVQFEGGEQEKRLPLLREACDRIFDGCGDITLLRTAARIMCIVCGDDELKKYLNIVTTFATREKPQWLEERHKRRGDREKYLSVFYANNFQNAATTLAATRTDAPYFVGLQTRYDIFNARAGLIEKLCGGTVADGWLVCYIGIKTRCSAMLMALDRREEGFDALDAAVSTYERWAAIPEGAFLDTGCPELFGGVKLKKGDYHLWIDGEPGFYYDTLGTQGVDLYIRLTAASGWEWFDSVRGDPRYIAATERARAASLKDGTMAE